MTLRKASGLFFLLVAVPCFANMVISNAPHGAAAGGGGSGQIQLVQATGDRLSGGNLALTLTSPGSGRLLTMQGGGGNASAPTDNYGHTWTLVKSQPSAGSEPAWVYYYVTTASYTGSYTVTKPAGGVAITASVAEWSRTSGSFTVDISTGKTGSASTTYTTGASATTHADSSLAIGAVVTGSGVNSAISGPASWGELFTESNGSVWLAGATHFSTASVASTSLNPSWSDSSTTYGSVLAVFK